MDLRIIFYGRGGQGAKSSADILAKVAIYQGYHAQSISKHGAEKSGTPVNAFLKISDKHIKSYAPITKCDFLVILDDTLLAFNPDIVKLVDPNSKYKTVLLNTNKKDVLSKSKHNIITIDATGIALKNIGINKPNTTLLARLIKELDFNIKVLNNVVAELFEEKKDVIDSNLRAIKEAYK